MKPKLNISFSGGRTSAVMTRRLFKEYKDTHEIIITFANTSCEDEETLIFVDKCDKEFGWGVVWIEAVINPKKGVGVRHRITNFENALRDGSLMADAVAKYSVFNRTNPACTARLKTEPMHDYLKTRGFIRGKKLNYETAIGFRADEADRASINADRFKFIYPMIDWGMTKEKVNLEINKWDFDLGIKGDHYGNCRWCWKKSDRKLYTLALDDETIFDVPAKLEKEYGHMRADETNKRHTFFRRKRTAPQIIEEAKRTNFEPYRDDSQMTFLEIWDETWAEVWDEMDDEDGCGESCEVYPSDYTE